MRANTPFTPPQGFRVLPDALDRAAQEQLLAEVAAVIEAAPLFIPTLPRIGQPMTVRMTNSGPLGWVTDRDGGYRYQATHPTTGAPWPPIPPLALALWRSFSGYRHDPEACLVNFYGAEARMGLHLDKDEAALEAPVLSISLGDTALFRLGGPDRKAPTRSLKLASGAVVVLGGAARACYHGVDRILAGSSRLLEGGGRLNLTLRRVTLP